MYKKVKKKMYDCYLKKKNNLLINWNFLKEFLFFYKQINRKK